MAKSKYDIFISYRRRDAGDKAEHLKDLLESKYKGRISFDRENLTGLFDVALARAQEDIREKGFNDPKYWASFILLDAFK